MNGKDFNLVYSEWEPKIRTMSNKAYVKDNSIDSDDIFQELVQVLWKCYSLYDPSVKVKFNTYFYTAAYNQIYMLMARAGARKRSGECVNLDVCNISVTDEGISGVTAKIALFNSIDDKQVRDAIEYILDGGKTRDLPPKVVRKMKKMVDRSMIY